MIVNRQSHEHGEAADLPRAKETIMLPMRDGVKLATDRKANIKLYLDSQRPSHVVLPIVIEPKP